MNDSAATSVAKRLAAAEQLTQRLDRAASTTEAFGDVHVDVAATDWHRTLEVARDDVGLNYLDWLSAYDDTPAGFKVVAHVVDRSSGARLLVRTSLPDDSARLATVTDLWPGAAWHERETWEMFGIDFVGHPRLESLLLQPEFDGRPLRKDFVLASRLVRPWPGTKEPGEPGAQPGRRARRRLLPPGVPPERAQP